MARDFVLVHFTLKVFDITGYAYKKNGNEYVKQLRVKKKWHVGNL